MTQDGAADSLQKLCRDRVHKRDFGIPMMQPHRIGIAQERARQHAARADLSADFLSRLYEVVIEETCLVIGQSPPP